MNFESIITDLTNLKKQNSISVKKIEWWLLKYSKLYKKTYDFVYSQYLFISNDGAVIRLPPFGKSTNHERFLDLFKALNTISEYYRFENYFKQEMVEYQNIKHSQSDLRNWIIKNEYLGTKDFVLFLTDYLDYSQNVEHLKVYVHSIEKLDIYIDRQDFKHTIDFLEIFNELYWVQQILPESIQKIKVERSKLPFDDTYWDRMSENFNANELF